MPLYEYYCTTCDTEFEQRRPASEFAAAAVCSKGHDSARRVVSMFATLSAGNGGSALPMGGGGGCCGGGACACGH